MVENIRNSEFTLVDGDEGRNHTILLAQAETSAPDAGAPVAEPAETTEVARLVIEVENGEFLRLPANASVDQPRVNGTDLEFVQPDGSIIVVPEGAIIGLTIFIGDIEIPPQTVAALFQANGIEAAAGPGAAGSQSSGGNFERPVGGIGDAFDLGDLLPPTALAFTNPDSRELFPGNTPPRFAFGSYSGRISEEGLAGANPDGTPFGSDTTNSIIVTGDLGAFDPEDNPLSFYFNDVTAGLTSNGVAITWEGIGTDVLIGRVGDDVAIIATVGGATGTYSVMVLRPLDHADGTTEDGLPVAFGITADDGFGGTASTVLTVTVEDDSPEIDLEVSSNVIVDEDGLEGGIGDEAEGDDAGGIEGDETTAEGSLGIQWGADNGDKGSDGINPDGSFAQDSAAAGGRAVYFSDANFAAFASANSHLTSGGETLNFTLSPDSAVITAWIGEGEARTDIFRVSLSDEGNGGYKFQLLGKLDHLNSEGEGQGSEELVSQLALESDNASFEDDIVLEFDYTARDADGDTVGGNFSVTVDDDMPVLVFNREHDYLRRVDEDDIRTGLSLGTSTNDGPHDGSYTGDPLNNASGPAYIFGNLGGVVNFGADGFGRFAINTGAFDTFIGYGLTSKGISLSYGSATDGDWSTFTATAGVRTVFEFRLNTETGEYEFHLFDQLDHDRPGDDWYDGSPSSDQNLDLQDGLDFWDVFALDFGSIVRAYDGDDDYVDLNNQLLIKIKDDVPELVLGRSEVQVVDEQEINTALSDGTRSDAYPDGVDGNDSYTTIHGGAARVTGTLAHLVQSGADEALRFSFVGEEAMRDTLSDLGLSSQGRELSYDLVGNVLWGFVNKTGIGQSYDDHEDRPVFKLTVNTDGSYTFDLIDQLDHDWANGENFDLEVPGYDIGTINFGSVIKATDFDGDSIVLDEAFRIKIKDDVPELVEGAKVHGVVEEEQLPHGNEDTQAYPWDLDADWGSFLPWNLFTTNVASSWNSGGLGSLIVNGADEVGTFSFVDGLVGSQVGALTSAGVPVTITGIETFGPHTVLVASAGGEPIFALAIDADGNWLFTLKGQIDHHPTDGADNVEDILALDLSGLIQYTDFDGDSVSLDGSFVIKIIDDTPVADIDLRLGAKLVLDETRASSPQDTASDPNADDEEGIHNPFLSNYGQLIGYAKGGSGSLFNEYGRVGADRDGGTVYSLSLGQNNDSGVADTATGQSIYLFTNQDGDIVGRVGGTDGAVAFVVRVDGDDGDVRVYQFRAVEHDNAGSSQGPHDEADSPEVLSSGKIFLTQTVTDEDGDQDSDSIDIGKVIRFEDDGPLVAVQSLDQSDVTHDESEWPQNVLWNLFGPSGDSDDEDVGVLESLFNVSQLFGAVTGKGDDPHVSDAAKLFFHGAIGYAQSTSALVSVDVDFGADDAAGSDSLVYALKLGGGVSGLETTDGHAIALSLVDGIVIGRVVGGDHAGEAAIAIHIDADSGKVTIAQWLSIKHGDTGNHDDGISLAANAVKVEVTATDGDGDTHSASTDVSNQIRFEDDGVELEKFTLKSNVKIVHDETPDVDGDANDVAGTPSALFTDIVGGDDAHVTGTGAIGYAQVAGADLFKVKADFGSDGPLAGGYGYQLVIGSGATALKTTEGHAIALELVDGIVVGKVTAGPDSGKAAFALHIDAATGDVTLAQYLSLQHPTGGASHDEGVWLSKDAIKVTLIVTDGDGDTDSKTINIGNKIGFQDDGPTATLGFRPGTDHWLSTDETTGKQADEPAGIATVFAALEASAIGAYPSMAAQYAAEPDFITTIGTDFGSDGKKSAIFSLVLKAAASDLEVSIGDRSITLFAEEHGGKSYIVGRFDADGGTVGSDDPAAFALYVDPATGTVHLAQYVPLEQADSNSSNEPVYLPENLVSLVYTVTDGDDDQDSAELDLGGAVRFLDDAPTLVANATPLNAAVEEDGMSGAATGDHETGNKQPGDTDADDETTGLAGSLTQFVHFGADAGSFGLAGLSVIEASLPTLYSHGEAVSYAVSGNVLTASTSIGTVFTLTVHANGSWSFDLVDRLDHVDDGTDSENYALRTDGPPVDGIDFSGLIVATDNDGDSITGLGAGKFIVRVQDDVPTIAGVSVVTLGAELIVNGGFEDGHGLGSGSNWNLFDGITGWTKGGNIPFEVQSGGAGGVPNTDGAVVELDGDTQSQGGSGAQPSAEGTNATIQQTVGTEVGEAYELSFQYAPRGNTAGLEVYLGGEKVFDSDDETYAANQWHMIKITLTAQVDDAVLAFTDTGTEDEFGALIDSVSLKAVLNGLDDESQDDGIPGGPGDDASGKTHTGTIDFDAGADGLKSIAFNNAVAVTNAKGETVPLQAIFVDADGLGHIVDVTLAWTPSVAGGTLTGTMEHDDEPRTVFTATINAAGQFTIEMLAPLAHPFTDPDFANNGAETEFEDNLTLNLGYTITDDDDDTATGTISVNVDDDTPDFVGASDINAGNGAGSFEGSFVFHAGADGVGSIDFDGLPEGLTSGGAAVQYSVEGNVLIAHTGDTTDPVFTVTLDIANGKYAFDSFRPLDGETETVTIGGSTSFGAGPDMAYVLTSGGAGTGEALAIVSGWGMGGDLRSVNGSNNGWGVNNANLGSDEMLRFDFGDADDFDGVGAYSVGAFDGPDVSEASFSFKNFSGDTLGFVVYYTDGTNSGAGALASPTAHTFSAPAGKFIDYIEITGQSVGGGGGAGGMVALTSVGRTNTTIDIDLDFGVTITDGDGDAESAAFTISIKDTAPEISGLTPKANGGDLIVDEDDLPTGTDTVKESTTQTGNFTVTSDNGIALLKIAGHDVVVDGVFAATDIVTPLGNTLSITGYNSETGVVSYSYTLLDNENHPSGAGRNALFEDFAVHLEDDDGDIAIDTLSVRIVDDIPFANSETEQNVAEGAPILKGEFAFQGGADGATLTHINGASVGPFDAGTGWSAWIDLTHGQIRVTADGSYQFETRADDAYEQGIGEIAGTFTVTDADGDKSTAGFAFNVTDDSDTTYANLSVEDVTEDDTNVTFTVTLTNPSQSDTTVVVRVNGVDYNVVIGNGDDEGSFTVNTQDSDVYTDPASITGEIISATGGDFEDLDIDTATATAAIADTIDTVTATLTASEAVAGVGGVTITYTVTLSGGPGDIEPANGPLVFTLTDGTEVTINAGQPSGSFAKFYTFAEITGSTVVNAIVDVDGEDEYENLATAGSTSVEVSSELTVEALALGTVEEEHGLLGGIEDQGASPDLDDDTANSGVDADLTTNVVSGSFAPAVTGGQDGTLSFAIAAVDPGTKVELVGGADLTSGGHQVYFAVNGAGDLVGYTNTGGGTGPYGAGDTTVFTLSLDEGTGSYTFTLHAPIDHHATGDNVEGNVAIDLNGRVTVSDSGGPGADTAEINASVTVINDVPDANDSAAPAIAGTRPSVNIVLVIDTSGSMGSGEGSRMELAKAAAINLLQNQDVVFNNVMVVEFNANASHNTQNGSNWTDVNDAISFISDLNAGGGTNYDDALQEVMESWGAGPGAADQTLTYFISDGEPTASNRPDSNSGSDYNPELGDGIGEEGINSSDQDISRQEWEAFLIEKGVDTSYAIGVGSGVSVGNLEPIAWAPGNANLNPVIIAQASELNVLLTGSLPGNPSGNLFDNGGGFGADGGHVASITILNQTFTYDGGATGKQIIIDSSNVPGFIGKMVFNFADNGLNQAGDWDYFSPTNSAGTLEFDYVLVDGDGDAAEGTLTIDVQLPPNVAPVAIADKVLTNIVDGSAIDIPDEALLYNDTDADGDTLDVFGVGGASGGTVGQGSSSVTFDPTDPAEQTGTSVYNFSGVSRSTNDHFAYQFEVDPSHDSGITSALDAIMSGPNFAGLAEATDEHYGDLASNDGNRWTTDDPGKNDNAVFWAQFKIEEAAEHITSFTVTLNGEQSGDPSDDDDGHLGIWNYASEQWETIDVDHHESGDGNWSATISNNVADYLDPVTNQLTIALYNEDTSDRLIVDYVEVSVDYSIPATFEDGSFTYTANDGLVDSVVPANVTVEGVNSDTIEGDGDDEILIAKNGVSGTRTVTAAVQSGGTYSQSANSAFSFTFLAAAMAGESITKIQIDATGHGTFDQNGPLSRDFELGSNSDVTPSSVTSGDTPVLTITFVPGEFVAGDTLLFGIDSDDGLDNGGDFGDDGVPFTITFSDGSTMSGTYQSDGSASIASVSETVDVGSTLIGNGGDDFLVGGDGNDFLIGGDGNDILFGGDGADVFYFAESGDANADTIKDYVFGDGDAIDLSELLEGVAVTQGNVGTHVSVTDAGADAVISVGGATVATLENFDHASPIKILVDGDEFIIDL